MAIEKTYLLGKNITLGCGFDLQAKAPLDSRQVVPEYDGLQALIDGNAAYEGMIVYDEGTKKTYQAQLVDGVLAFREFGINEAELKALIASETTAAMEFKGVATALPENPSKGDFYKVTTSFDVAEGETAKIGDSIVYDGEQWFIIPSGDDIEDTWRPVTGVDNDASLTFAAGDKLEKTVAADGTITYKHVAIDAPTATPVGEDEQTRTYIASIETDGHGHITGYKTATENVEDTNTTYEFEGLPVGEDEEAPSSVYFQVKSSDEEAAEVVYLDAYSKNEADGKFVAKEIGKSLVSDDEIARLANVDNYDDEEVRGLIDAIDNHSHENKDVLDGITAAKVADWDDAVSKEHTHTFADSDVEDAIAKKHSHTFTDADVEDAISKEHTHSFSDEEALNGITAAKVADWDDAVSKEHTHSFEDTDVEDAIAKKHAHTFVDTDVEDAISKKHSHTFVEAELNKIADGDVAKWNTAAGKADDNAQAIEDLEGYVGTFTHATAKTVVEYINAKTDGIATSGNLEALGTRVTTAEGKITDLETASATHATKDELKNVDDKFANYNTTEAQKAIDDAQDARIKAIEDDYLVEADIANFETKENVKKVADDLVVYVESNDKALADEVKARDDADKAFETRIAALEGNFGDGEGTVEAQIAAAVKAEEDARKEAVKGVQDEVDAVEGRMDTAEGKIAALETEAAKHAVKTEVEGALALKADKSVVDAMYTNAQIDGFIAEAKKYADDNDADTQYGIVYDSDTKKIKLVSDTSKTEIDATDFIKDGMIESVALSEDGLNLVITWNTDSDKGENNVTTIPLNGLVDIYTGVDGTTVTVTVSSDDKISAEVKTGSIKDGHIASDAAIAKGKLAADVQASLGKADSALQEHQDISHLATTAALNGVDAKFANYTNTTDMNAKFDLKADKTQVATDIATAKGEAIAAAASDAQGKVDALANGQVKTNKEAIEAINNESTGILKQAKDYADGLAGNYAEAEHDHVAADITDFESTVATKVESYGYATATDVANQDAVVLAEAQKHAEDKVTELAEGAVATNAGNIETLFEMFQWGEF